MALKFQAPNLPEPKSKYEALNETAGKTAASLPILYQQMKQQHLASMTAAQQAADTHKLALAKAGTGAPAPVAEGPATAAGVGPITPPESFDSMYQRGGSDLVSARSADTKAQTDLLEAKQKEKNKIWVDPNDSTKLSLTEKPGFQAVDFETVKAYHDAMKPATKPNELTDQELSAITKATQRKDNPLPTSLLKSRGFASKVIAQALLNDENYSPTDAEISFAVAKGGAESEAKTKAKAVGAIEPMAKTLDDVLFKMEPLIAKLSPTQIQTVNKAYLNGLAKIAGDEDANALLTHANEATSLYASVMKGGTAAPSDMQFSDAKGVIGNGLSPSAFAGVKKAVMFGANSRIKHLRESGSGDNSSGKAQYKLVGGKLVPVQ
jgi:hypothetical protein